MGFEQFPKKQEKPQTNDEKIKEIVLFEKETLSRFCEGRLGKLAVALSFMTALAAASIEKAYSADLPDQGSGKEAGAFFDLSGKKSSIDGKAFMVAGKEMVGNINSTPSAHVDVSTAKSANEKDPNNFIEDDANGNVRSRNIGEIR